MVSEKVWAGSGVRDTGLTAEQFNQVYARLNGAAPGQNLNRAVKLDSTSGNTVFQYDTLSSPITTSFESVGPPYTLSFTIKPHYATQRFVSGFFGRHFSVPLNAGEGSAIFAGKDSRLFAKNLAFEDTTTKVLYRLDFDPPEDVETTVEIHATRKETYALINRSEEKHYYRTELDIWGQGKKVVDMSFAAPSNFIGNLYAGELKSVKLVRGA
jgi:hexosaminidase